MKLHEGKNNEIRRVMRKYSLRVNRLIRVSYGPYTIGLVPEPNKLAEVSVQPEIRRLLYRYYKSRAAEATRTLDEAQNEVTSDLSLKLKKANSLVENIIGKENVPLIEEEEDSTEEEETASKTGFGRSRVLGQAESR